ncbi:MAG: hypothetical protein WBG50_16910 [Desulfomonilaceae bacterium]
MSTSTPKIIGNGKFVHFGGRKETLSVLGFCASVILHTEVASKEEEEASPKFGLLLIGQARETTGDDQETPAVEKEVGSKGLKQ